MKQLDLDRRDFFKSLGFGVLVVFAVPADAQRRGGGEPVPQDIAGWLHISSNGSVRISAGKAEMGQNIRTSLAQAAAEELRVPLDAIEVSLGDTDITPWDAGTFGSRTTPFTAPLIRRAAAAAREVLVGLAAETWQADRKTLFAANGHVSDPASGRSLAYGELTNGRQLVEMIPADIALTPAAEWKIAGTSAPKLNGRDIVTGKHRYASDVRLPGMLFGKVLRPPSFGATLATLDSNAAAAMPGVRVVREGDFAGVTASDPAMAEGALEALKAEWKTQVRQAVSAVQGARGQAKPPVPPSSHELNDYLRQNAESRTEPAYTAGSVEQALAAADRKLKATYTVAYIAHCPLEPRAAVARWKNGKLTVWTGSQRPFGIRTELARAFHLDEPQVRVIVPDTGSAYGGKHAGDAAIEAARLARGIEQPVKLVWTREEEFTWAYFRPAGVIDVSAGVRNDGAITAWEFHNYNSGGAAIRTYYEIPNQRIEFHPVRSPLRQGSYRGLAATANQFARESFMDELAALAGMSPLEFRQRNLKEPRLRAVLDAAADKFGWSSRKQAPGRGFGIACGFEKGGYIATCAEVEVDRKTGKVRVTRVVSAFDCGAVVNPRHLRNQMEGAINMGLGGALFEAIEFDKGKILNPHFSAYRLPRFSDAPAIETVLVDRKDQPSAGAGETPMIALAPAIGNAIANATGVRLRALPMAPNGVKLSA